MATKTQWHYDATGEVIRQVDAGQHLQRFSFDVAGRLNTVSLKLKDAEIEKYPGEGSRLQRLWPG
ncbi:hypothetical protein ACFS4T_04735 [Pseudomonas lini]